MMQLSILAALIASAVGTSTIPTVPQTQQLPLPDDLFDFRYCEVLWH
jgi:hypothetical protein